MTVLANGYAQGCLPDELKKVLKSVASDLGDSIRDINTLQVVDCYCFRLSSSEFHFTANQSNNFPYISRSQVIPLKGAMTNEVCQINWPTTEVGLVRKVLLRVYGEGVELFFNRDDEIRTFECMSKHGQGPRLLGRFAEGRVEEFIHAKVLILISMLI